MSVPERDEEMDDLVRRVYSEFLEMPGLRLTVKQAQRLWGIEEGTCVQLLECLVEANFLCHGKGGMYARAADGQASFPRASTMTPAAPRQLKAQKVI